MFRGITLSIQFHDLFWQRVVFREIADNDVGNFCANFFQLYPSLQKVVAGNANRLFKRRKRVESDGADVWGQDPLRDEHPVRVPPLQTLVQVIGQHLELHRVRPRIRTELSRPQKVFHSGDRRVDDDQPLSLAEHLVQAEHDSALRHRAQFVPTESCFQKQDLNHFIE